MSGKSKPKQPTAEPVHVALDKPGQGPGRLKSLGGSQSDDWNNNIANDTIQALWIFKNSDEKTKHAQINAALSVLIGIGPRDELEGMMAAQLIAAHSAAMECYRRAMIGDQTFEGRRESLSQANKLSRTFTQLLDALNRHRGKGQQKVTVEHVHVHSGGQAVVGTVEQRRGEGITRNPRNNPMQSKLPMHLSPRWGARTRSGQQCRSAAMANGRCRMHGGGSPGAPRGNKNALKHGRYTANGIAGRRHLSALIRMMKSLATIQE